MSTIIRKMTPQDRQPVLAMMRTFYASPAVWTNGSEEIFQADVDHCLSDCPYLEGYIFEDRGQILGYAMVAKSFSTEFGKPCMWIEDIYLQEPYRNRGIGSQFLLWIRQAYPDALLRLEVEHDNHRAIHVYQKCGFDVLPYMEMKQ